MIDREKVIEVLNYCCTHTNRIECPNCPYWHDDDCLNILHSGALVLLKAQEPVKVVRRVEETEWNVCSNCGSHIISKWKWCPYCGREVKW